MACSEWSLKSLYWLRCAVECRTLQVNVELIEASWLKISSSDAGNNSIFVLQSLFFQAANDLLKAILAHDVKAVSKLLSLHPETLLEVEYPEHEGKRPLQMAAVVGSPEIVTLLISAGAEVNSADSSGATAAHIAAQLGEMKILRILIEADADMNARTKRARETPLHLSFVDDRVGVVALLVDAGADINARDVQGETPLHEAAAYGARRSVGFLLATGADTSIRDSRGRTPHDMVCLCLQFVNIPQMLQCSEEQCEEEDIAALVDSLEAVSGTWFH